MKEKVSIICLLAFILLIIGHCTNFMNGEGNSTNTGNSKCHVKGKLVTPDNQPAVNTMVIIKDSDTTVKQSDTTFTDEQGQYEFKIAKKGVYFIICRKEKKAVLYIDNITIETTVGELTVPTYTINKFGSISGKVVLANVTASDDKTIILNIKELGLRFQTEHEKEFTINDVPEGKYVLLITTLSENHGFKYDSISITNKEITDLGEVVIEHSFRVATSTIGTGQIMMITPINDTLADTIYDPAKDCSVNGPIVITMNANIAEVTNIELVEEGTITIITTNASFKDNTVTINHDKLYGYTDYRFSITIKSVWGSYFQMMRNRFTTETVIDTSFYIASSNITGYGQPVPPWTGDHPINDPIKITMSKNVSNVKNVSIYCHEESNEGYIENTVSFNEKDIIVTPKDDFKYTTKYSVKLEIYSETNHKYRTSCFFATCFDPDFYIDSMNIIPNSAITHNFTTDFPISSPIFVIMSESIQRVEKAVLNFNPANAIDVVIDDNKITITPAENYGYYSFCHLELEVYSIANKRCRTESRFLTCCHPDFAIISSNVILHSEMTSMPTKDFPVNEPIRIVMNDNIEEVKLKTDAINVDFLISSITDNELTVTPNTPFKYNDKFTIKGAMYSVSGKEFRIYANIFTQCSPSKK